MSLPTVLPPSTSSHVDMKYPPPHTSDYRPEDREMGASHQPGISTVGSLFIVCDLALIGANVQTQRQIRCLIPHSKPSVRDARQSDA